MNISMKDVTGLDVEEKLKELTFGILFNTHTLADSFDKEVYLLLNVKLLYIQNLVQGLILNSYEGNVKIFNKCKEYLKQEIEALILAHEDILKTVINNRNQNLQ